MSEWVWIQDIREHLAESEFLKANKKGADIGGKIGAVAVPLAVLACAAYAATGPTVASVRDWGAATSAAAAPLAITLESGARAFAAADRKARFKEAGRLLCKWFALAIFAVKNVYLATKVLGELLGAYTGATVQAMCRKIAGAFERH